jgi:hypothetical protein
MTSAQKLNERFRSITRSGSQNIGNIIELYVIEQPIGREQQDAAWLGAERLRLGPTGAESSFAELMLSQLTPSVATCQPGLAVARACADQSSGGDCYCDASRFSGLGILLDFAIESIEQCRPRFGQSQIECRLLGGTLDASDEQLGSPCSTGYAASAVRDTHDGAMLGAEHEYSVLGIFSIGGCAGSETLHVQKFWQILR